MYSHSRFERELVWVKVPRSPPLSRSLNTKQRTSKATTVGEIPTGKAILEGSVSSDKRS